MRLRPEYHKLIGYALIGCVVFLSYGAILWNGAGWSHPDDQAAVDADCCAFRPLTGATYAINRWLGGGWTLVNLCLHGAMAMLLYRFSGQWIAGALFAAHPLAADAVASMAARSAIIAAVGVGLVITARLRWVAVPVVILAIGMTPKQFLTVEDAPALAAHTFRFTGAIGGYFIPRIFVPVQLSADPEISVRYVGVLAIAVVIGAMWIWPKYRKPGLLLLVPLIPYALIPLPDPFFEHRGYLALAGGCWLIALLPRSFALALLPLFIVIAQERAVVYQSSLTLWVDAASKAPNKARTQVNAGIVLARHGRYREAEAAFQRAIQLNPDMEQSWNGLAMMYIARNNFTEASRVMDEWDAHRKVEQ